MVREAAVVDHFKPGELNEYQQKCLQWEGAGFDTRTHIIDPKSGRLLREQHYRYVVDDKVGSYFIRGGKRYSEQGHCLDPDPKVGVKADDQKLPK